VNDHVTLRRVKAVRFRRRFRWFLLAAIAVNVFASMSFLIYGRVPWLNAFGAALLVGAFVHNEVWIERLR
jgi:hypothetical protein